MVGLTFKQSIFWSNSDTDEFEEASSSSSWTFGIRGVICVMDLFIEWRFIKNSLNMFLNWSYLSFFAWYRKLLIGFLNAVRSINSSQSMTVLKPTSWSKLLCLVFKSFRSSNDLSITSLFDCCLRINSFNDFSLVKRNKNHLVFKSKSFFCFSLTCSFLLLIFKS